MLGILSYNSKYLCIHDDQSIAWREPTSVPLQTRYEFWENKNWLELQPPAPKLKASRKRKIVEAAEQDGEFQMKIKRRAAATTILNLKTQVNELKDALAEAKKDQEAIANELDTCKQELQACKEANVALSTDLYTCKKVSTDLEDRLDKFQQVNAALEAEVRKCKQVLKRKDTEIESMQRKMLFDELVKQKPPTIHFAECSLPMQQPKATNLLSWI